MSDPTAEATLDRDLVFLDVSQEYLEMTGATRESLIGRKLFDVFPEDPDRSDGTLPRRALQGVLDTGQVREVGPIRYDIPGSGGLKVRWWRLACLPVLGDSGEVKAIRLRLNDLTDEVIDRYSTPDFDVGQAIRELRYATPRFLGVAVKRWMLLAGVIVGLLATVPLYRVAANTGRVEHNSVVLRAECQQLNALKSAISVVLQQSADQATGPARQVLRSDVSRFGQSKC